MTRPHLSIGEVLALLQTEFPDVTISKIRFLESQGLLDPERTPSGYRKFYEDDILRLRWILRQQRENFLPLKVIKDRLESGVPLTDDPEPVAPPATDPAPVATAAGDGPALAPNSNGTLPLPTEPPEPGGGGAATDSTPASDSTPGAERPPTSRTARPAARSTRRTATGTAAEPTPTGGPTAVQRSFTPAGDAFDRLRASVAGDPAAPADGDGPAGELPGASMSRRELLTASGLEENQLADLERFGLVQGAPVGRDLVYDEEALTVSRLAESFARYGVEARHLRMYKNAADREVGFIEQIVQPTLKQKNPSARKQALEQLAELATLGANLRASLVRAALRDITNNG